MESYHHNVQIIFRTARKYRMCISVVSTAMVLQAMRPKNKIEATHVSHGMRTKNLPMPEMERQCGAIKLCPLFWSQQLGSVCVMKIKCGNGLHDAAEKASASVLHLK